MLIIAIASEKFSFKGYSRNISDAQLIIMHPINRRVAFKLLDEKLLDAFFQKNFLQFFVWLSSKTIDPLNPILPSLLLVARLSRCLLKKLDCVNLGKQHIFLLYDARIRQTKGVFPLADSTEIAKSNFFLQNVSETYSPKVFAKSH